MGCSGSKKPHPADKDKNDTTGKASNAAMGKMSKLEKEVFNELMLARTQPKVYAGYIEERIKYIKGNQLEMPDRNPWALNEGVNAYKDAVRDLQRRKPVGQCSAPLGMHRAAEDKCKGGSASLGDRLNKYGTWSRECTEIVAKGNHKDGRDIVIFLLTDDGNPQRSNREDLLSGKFDCVGISTAADSKYTGMCVVVMTSGFADK